MFKIKYPSKRGPKEVKGFSSKKDAAKWIKTSLSGRERLDATIVTESLEDRVDTILNKQVI